MGDLLKILEIPEFNSKELKQKLFCEEWVVDRDGKNAAIRAGYSPKTADQQASRMLTKVKVRQYIDYLVAERSKRTEISVDMVLNELAKLAFFDVRKLYDGNGNLKPITELDDETAAGIVGIDVVEMAGAAAIGDDGVGHVAMYTKKLKLADKRAALVDIGRHLKMFTDRIEIGLTDDLAERVRRAKEVRGV